MVRYKNWLLPWEYDLQQVERVLGHLSDDLKRQAEGDRGRNRPKLANALDETANRVEDVQLAMDHVWFICKPFMNEEINP